MANCAIATNEQAIGLVQKIWGNYSEAPFQESNKEQEYRHAASSVAEVVNKQQETQKQILALQLWKAWAGCKEINWAKPE